MMFAEPYVTFVASRSKERSQASCTCGSILYAGLGILLFTACTIGIQPSGTYHCYTLCDNGSSDQNTIPGELICAISMNSSILILDDRNQDYDGKCIELLANINNCYKVSIHAI